MRTIYVRYKHFTHIGMHVHNMSYIICRADLFDKGKKLAESDRGPRGCAHLAMLHLSGGSPLLPALPVLLGLGLFCHMATRDTSEILGAL